MSEVFKSSPVRHGNLDGIEQETKTSLLPARGSLKLPIESYGQTVRGSKYAISTPVNFDGYKYVESTSTNTSVRQVRKKYAKSTPKVRQKFAKSMPRTVVKQKVHKKYAKSMQQVCARNRTKAKSITHYPPPKQF